MKLEAYFKHSWDVDFTHSICPDCYKAEIRKLAPGTAAEADRPPAGAGSG